MNAVLKYVRRWLVIHLMATKVYNWFLSKIMPKLRLSNSYTKLDGDDYRVAYDRLKPGDIIVTSDNSNMITKLIGGMYSNAALCVAKDPSGKHIEIVEMIGPGYKEIAFYDLAKECDKMAILRCDAFDPEYVEKLVERALSFKGATYDRKFQFESGLKALYCSELIYEADFERRMDVSLEDLVNIRREYISPTGLYMGKNISRIFISKPVKK